jgi:uncharacterized membrane protein YheB (UPF0754 family)
MLVVIGGIIGYVTNKVAIKMLFRPVNPIKIGPFTLQGVFPKRKDKMAESLADTIEKELLNKDQIMNQIIDGLDLDDLKNEIKTILISKISAAIPPMAKMFVGNVEQLIEGFINKESEGLFEDILNKIKDQASTGIDIHGLVKKRIDELDFIEFEKIIFGLMSKELRHIEIIGLFLGMMIGALQYLVTLIQF